MSLSDQSSKKRLLKCILFAGICLRVVVFLFLSPFNNDGRGHLAHAVYIQKNWALPPAALGHEMWQPPLYYALSAIFAYVSSSPKFIQVFALLTSVATLFIVRRLVESETFLRTGEGKMLAFMVVAFLPQFVTFGLYISNDSLATLLGFWTIYALDRLQESSTTRRFLELVLILSLGLLTKGQFLVVTAVVLPLAGWLHWRTHSGLRGRTVLVYALSLMLLLLGSIKYIDNTKLYGRPLISNLDFKPPWIKTQQGTYLGLSSIIDINVFKLLKNPTEAQETRHSIPLLLYGTFWYEYIAESNFRGNQHSGPKYIGRYMDLIGILPTSVGILGALLFPLEIWRRRHAGSVNARVPELARWAAIVIFAANLLMVLWAFYVSDVWSILQARSLFPSIMGCFVLFDLGIQSIANKVRLATWFHWWRNAFLIGAGSYFGVEVLLRLREVLLKHQ